MMCGDTITSLGMDRQESDRCDIPAVARPAHPYGDHASVAGQHRTGLVEAGGEHLVSSQILRGHRRSEQIHQLVDVLGTPFAREHQFAAVRLARRSESTMPSPLMTMSATARTAPLSITGRRPPVT